MVRVKDIRPVVVTMAQRLHAPPLRASPAIWPLIDTRKNYETCEKVHVTEPSLFKPVCLLILGALEYQS
jgi:hypothetical protein